MAAYPRLQARLRRLERQRHTLERFADGLEEDNEVSKTHADAIVSLEAVNDEINELEQIFLFSQIWTIAIWLLPAILLMISVAVVLASWV